MPNLKIKICHKYLCLAKTNSTSRIQYYRWFRAFIGGLGMYRSWIRISVIPLRPGSSASQLNAQGIQQGLLSGKWELKHPLTSHTPDPSLTRSRSLCRLPGFAGGPSAHFRGSFFLPSLSFCPSNSSHLGSPEL